MILLKGFLRKKKTKLYIRILSLLFVVLFLLKGFSLYTKELFDEFKYKHTSFLAFARTDQENRIKKEKGITSYRRALTFDIGLDNDIIYSPPLKINGTAVEYAEPIDTTKIVWNRLTYNDTILAFTASSCNKNLSNNQVILALDEKDYEANYKDNFINKEIIFKFNNEELKLIVNDFLDAKTFNYICISDNIYNELLPNNENYIYEINTMSYKDLTEIQNNWTELKNDFYSLEHPEKYKEVDESNKEIYLNNMVSMFNIVDIISLIIFFVLVIFVIKDLVTDEEKDILLLKEIGFNKRQSRINSLRNLFVLDGIAFLISFVICDLLTFIINSIFYINIEWMTIKSFMQISIFVFFVEVVFTMICTRENSCNKSIEC